VVSPEQGVNNVRSEINLAIWRAFRAHGIAVPFPQREVRLLDGGRLDDARDRSPSP
jgi:small-conductance mechanosensitive channel